MHWRTVAEWCGIFLNRSASVVPPYGDSDTIAKPLRGKVPGTLSARTGKWVGTTGSNVDRFMTLAEALQADIDGACVGMWAQHFPGLDADVDHQALTDKIVALAKKVLGPAPVRGRHGTPRCLLMYMTEELIRKHRLSFRKSDWPEEKKSNAVELLGQGQYYNVDGLHPSGKPYIWDVHPCDLGPWGLSLITLAMVEAFFKALRELLESEGYEVDVKAAGKSNSTGGPRTALTDPSLWAPSPQLVLELLREYRPETMGHDDFVQHLVAIKASLGEFAEEFYDDVLAWAPGVRSTEDEATRKRWDSITDATIGWPWLAAKSGTTVAAQHEFDRAPDEKNMPEDPRVVALRDITKRWAFDKRSGLFHDTVNVTDVSKETFNGINTHLALYGARSKNTSVALCLNTPDFIKADNQAYQPGDAYPFIRDNGKVTINIWRPSLLALPKNYISPEPWLKLMAKLLPNTASNNHVQNWMAYMIQKPGKKIGHAILCYSETHGVGKDSALVPLIRGVGEENVKTIRPKDLTNDFNAYLKSQLIICSEMANFDKKEIYNHLKTNLETSETRITVNPKYGAMYEIKNMQNWWFNSNYQNAVSLDETDRRFFVEECPSIVMTPKEADTIHFWYKDGGAASVVLYLQKLPISEFNPAHTPPMTEAKANMIKVARPIAVRWVLKQFEPGGMFHLRTLIIVKEIIMGATDWGGPQTQVYENNVTAALRILNFTPIPARISLDGVVTTIWAANTVKTEIRNSTGILLEQRLKADQKH